MVANAVTVDADYRGDRAPDTTTPERIFWRAVLLQAMRDAFGDSELRRYLARRFLRGPGLAVAVDFAGLPGYWVPTLRAWKPGNAPAVPAGVRHVGQRLARKTLAFGGVTRALGEWAWLRGIRYDCLAARLQRGWTPAQALGFAPPPQQRRGGMRQVIHVETQSGGRPRLRHRPAFLER